MNLMKRFRQDRKKLIDNWKIKYIESDNLPYLEINDLPLLAGFTGYLKFQCSKMGKNSKVFYRGQTTNWKLIPSLFRDYTGIDTDNARIKLRLKAYKELVKKTPCLYNAYRFKDENLGAIFQHYGIRTPWIDLVDNVFVAIWFATHRFEEDCDGLVKCKPSREEYGWIYYFQVSDDDDIKYYDVRECHSSLSLRLHSQHGISATRQNDNWDICNRNLDEYVCARVKFPVTRDLLGGCVFDSAFMFPNKKFDNTYKYLRRKKFSELLQKIVNDNGLEKGELGHITVYG